MRWSRVALAGLCCSLGLLGAGLGVGLGQPRGLAIGWTGDAPLTATAPNPGASPALAACGLTQVPPSRWTAADVACLASHLR